MRKGSNEEEEEEKEEVEEEMVVERVSLFDCLLVSLIV